MSTPAATARPRGLALALSWRRVRFVLIFAGIFGLMVAAHERSGRTFVRAEVLGLFVMLAFGLFEQWPIRLPRWLARWVLQVLGTAAAVPIGTALIFAFTTESGLTPEQRRLGFDVLTGVGLFVAPWTALAALVRQKDAMVRHQALEFDLQRTELERQALDARLNLLQAQVAPHFLFNTLANIQALVDAGSPQASAVLRSLIAYLRAAVPRLNEPSSTFGQELDLVRAYLELMHMRMPDRLTFSLHADEATLALRCPPMTLLTLVENAVRHGIDPSEEGGVIEIHVLRLKERCVVRVTNTGAGIGQTVSGLGTGLSTLRERLRLSFGGDAQLRVSAHQPQGVCAELDLPALGAA